MRSFLAKLYCHCFLDELMLIYPFYALMFVDHGMSPMQLSILIAVWCAVTIALEVPSGVLADRHSRKGIMVAGSAIRACGYACWALFPGFWGFLAGFVLWGTEGAMGSGAFEALVYDELKGFGREDEYVRIQGRCRSLGMAGIVVSAAVATWAVSYGYGVLIAASSAAALAAGLLLWFLPTAAPAAATSAVGWRKYAATLRDGVGAVTLEPYARHLVVFAALSLALGGTLEEYWPIFAIELGLPRASPGVLLALLCAVQALASLVAHRLAHVPPRAVFAALALSGAGLFVAAWSREPAAIALVVVFVFVHQAIDVLYDGHLQSAIDSEHRATASSVKSLASEVGGIAAVMALGAVVTGREYSAGFEAFGVGIALLGLVFLVRGAPRPVPLESSADPPE